MKKNDIAQHFGHLEVDDELMVGVKNQINRVCRKMLIECFSDFSKGSWQSPSLMAPESFFWLPDDKDGILQGFAPIAIRFGPKDFEEALMWWITKDIRGKDRETIHPGDAARLVSFLSGFKKVIDRLERHLAKIPRVPED